MDDRTQFRHQVSTKTWIGKVYAHHLEDESVDVDLRKNPMVQAILAFHVPVVAYRLGVRGEEFEQLVNESLLALEVQHRSILSKYGHLLNSTYAPLVPTMAPAVPAAAIPTAANPEPAETSLPPPPAEVVSQLRSQEARPTTDPHQSVENLVNDALLMDDE